MGVKYFKELPVQKYYFKNYFTTREKEGCTCSECGTYITHIVTVIGSVDKKLYQLGTTCCEKVSKGLKNIDLDDKVLIKIKYFKSQERKIKDLRKSLDFLENKVGNKIIARCVDMDYRTYRNTGATLNFIYLYDNGDWLSTNKWLPCFNIMHLLYTEFAEEFDSFIWTTPEFKGLKSSTEVGKKYFELKKCGFENFVKSDNCPSEWRKLHEIRNQAIEELFEEKKINSAYAYDNEEVYMRMQKILAAKK